MTIAPSIASIAFFVSSLSVSQVASFAPNAVAPATRASGTTIASRHLSATAPSTSDDGDYASATARPKAVVFDLGEIDVVQEEMV